MLGGTVLHIVVQTSVPGSKLRHAKEMEIETGLSLGCLEGPENTMFPFPAGFIPTATAMGDKHNDYRESWSDLTLPRSIK
jgi:hypothetical protein